MKFVIAPNASVSNSSIYYIWHEDSFLFDPMPENYNGSALSIITINLMISPAGEIIGLSGYSPSSSWLRKTLEPPNPTVGTIMLEDKCNIPPDGCSTQLEDTESWKPYFDSTSNWFKISKPGHVSSGVKTFSGTRFLTDEVGKLVEVWVPVKVSN